MKAVRGVPAVFIVAIMICCCPQNVSAEYNSMKLGEAAGAYIISTDLLEKMSASQCGYVVKKARTRLSAVKEVLPYLSKIDQKDLLSFTKSAQFKAQLNENNAYIQGLLRSGKEGGLDEKTLCGMMAGIVSNLYWTSKNRWDNAVRVYSK